MNRRRVLIIDDDELIARSLCQWLTAKGCLCDVVCDARAALSLMQHARYDVVLVDPHLTGGIAGSLPELRAAQPDARFIVATAYASAELRDVVADHEMQLVEKPQPVVVLGHLITGR